MDFDKQLEAFRHRVLNHNEEDNLLPPTEPSKIPENLQEKEVVLYQTEDDNMNVSVYYYDETFWLTQKAMGELFGTTKQPISYHLNNIFKEGELDKDSVVKYFLTTASDGKKYNTLFYNLDAIIAVGYRINSMQATRFRQWATVSVKDK